MRQPQISPRAYHRLTLVALVALGVIIVTGGAVRLTGSGLGCPDWPTCGEGRLVAPAEYHPMVEFVNRTITGLVSIAVIVAVLGSLWRRPRRRDLVVLSIGLVAGVAGQVVLGGLTVLFHLKPQLVMAHFLLSMVILATAVVLHVRAGRPDGPARPLVSEELRGMSRLVVASAALVLFLGTVVTSSGPHGGDEDVERLSFDLRDVSRFHGASVILFLLLLLVVVWRLRAERAPDSTMRRGEVVVAVAIAQAAVGYTQYLTGVPALLVGVHIAGAVAVWVAVLRFHLGLSTVTEPVETTANPGVVAPAPPQRRPVETA